MSETQWTPGPWSVDGEGIEAIVRGADGTIVAVRHRLRRAENEANMRLIASAPDLYEAGRDAEALLKSVEGQNGLVDELLRRVREALARARGE
jgi:hypothetical protein